jgi:glycosyltransferase involved in cell wall biosynthesis
MARRLVTAGHKVQIITSSYSRTRASRTYYTSTEQGILVHWLPVPYSNLMSHPERIRSFLRFAWRSASMAASIPSDVVFATSTPLTVAIPGIAAKLRRRIPMVFEIRDLWPDLPIAVGALRNPLSKGLARLLEWIAYHASDHIVALSPGMAEGVCRRGIPASRVTVIPNSCDLELFNVPREKGLLIRERLGLAPEQPLVIYAGTFGAINGVEYLVHLAAAMRSAAPDIRFLLVGSGACLKSVEQQARDCGVLNKTLWIWDPLPKEEMPNLFAAATIVTSAFLPFEPMWNNSANKFFDALAAAKPIAINYGGWQADLIRETGAGIVLPPDDANEAARLLADFAKSKRLLQKASAAAHELALTRFARDKLAAELESVLLNVTAHRATRLV